MNLGLLIDIFRPFDGIPHKCIDDTRCNICGLRVELFSCMRRELFEWRISSESLKMPNFDAANINP